MLLQPFLLFLEIEKEIETAFPGSIRTAECCRPQYRSYEQDGGKHSQG